MRHGWEYSRPCINELKQNNILKAWVRAIDAGSYSLQKMGGRNEEVKRKEKEEDNNICSYPNGPSQD